jgi:SWI/SNF-related matrix-associated actin-dependent regulator 1 of chromatin subfamily A
MNARPQRLNNRIQSRIRDLSRATTSSIEIPAPEGCTYLPYQKVVAEYARLHPATLVGDEPGCGKTIEALAVSNDDLTLRRILIVCPAFLKLNWKQEWLKWDTKGLSVGTVSGMKGEFPATDVVIINYDLLKSYRANLRTTAWDLLVVDEIHRLKSKRADRTREVFGGIKRDKDKKIIDRTTPIPARRKLYMTGTPSLNGKPKELWPLLQSIDPTDIGSDWFAFAKRYCKLQDITRYNPAIAQHERIGWLWDGRDNLEELQERMRKNFMIRRLKSDVLKDLPPKRRIIIPIEPSGIRERKALDKELDEFKSFTEDREEALFEMPAFGDFSKKMLETGLRMVEPCVEIAESDLDEYNKIVIAVYHREVGEKIAAAFPNSILLTGDIDVDKRNELVAQFQNDPLKRVFIGTIGSCGVGFTLVAASLMIFCERSWVPGEITQMEDRIHRIGQTKNALYKHLVLEGSLSERQIRALVVKQDAADKMLDSRK